MMYTNYAIVKDGVVVEYPVNPRTWIISREAFNVPELWHGGILDGKEYVLVHTLEPHCHPTKNLVEKPQPFFDTETKLWKRQYDFVPASSEEIEERRGKYLRGAQELVAYFLADYYKKVPMIINLSSTEQTKWDAYRDALLAVPQQPDYPFTYTLPSSPEEQIKINIGVARI